MGLKTYSGFGSIVNGGRFTVANIGFAPVAVIFSGVGSTFTDADNMNLGLGFFDSSAEGSVYLSSTDNLDVADTAAGSSSTLALDINTPGGSMVVGIDRVSLDAEGFQADMSGQDGDFFGYMAIGGSGVQAKVLSATISDTDQGVLTGAGFQGNAVILIARTQTGVNARRTVGIGFATSSSNRATTSIMDQDGVGTSNNSRTQRTDRCLVLADTSSLLAEFDFVSFDSDGITLDILNLGATVSLFALVLKVPKAYVGSFLTPTSTGVQTYTDAGFPVNALILSCFGRGASSSVEASADMCVGFSGSQGQSGAYDSGAAAFGASEDNKASSNCNQAFSSSNVLVLKDIATGGGTSAALNTAAMDSWGQEGFGLDHTTVNALQSQVVYLALGDSIPTVHFKGGAIQGGAIL